MFMNQLCCCIYISNSLSVITEYHSYATVCSILLLKHELFPDLGYYEQSNSDHSWIQLFINIFSFFMGKYLEVEMLGIGWMNV